MLLLSKCILGGAGPNTQNSERIFGRSESCAYRPAVDLVEKLRMAMKKPCKGCEAQLNYYRLNPSIKWSHEESDCDSQLRLSAAWHWMSAAAEKRSLILLKANTMWLKCCNRCSFVGSFCVGYCDLLRCYIVEVSMGGMTLLQCILWEAFAEYPVIKDAFRDVAAVVRVNL